MSLSTTNRGLLTRGTYYLVGLILLVAAALKLYGLNVSPFAQYGWFSTPAVQLTTVGWEIVLGVWLLSGYNRTGAWAVAVVTFLTFAGVSLYLGLIGQASCGCFGAVQASPWQALTVDAVALAILWVVRPVSHGRWGLPRLRPAHLAVRALAATVGAAVILGLFTAVATLLFGSLDEALASLRDERVSIRPAFVNLDRGPAGQTVGATVMLVNRTDRQVRIIGGSSDCSCVVTDDLPLTLAAGESRPVVVRVRLPATQGFFNRKAYFWTDHDEARTILIDLNGRVDPAVERSAAGMVVKTAGVAGQPNENGR